MRIPGGFLSLLIGLALGSSGLAVEPAGLAVAVNPQATGALDGAGTVRLRSGDDVFLGQTVITGNAGEVQIVFSDQTHLVIGPGARLVIAEYLMRNDTSASKVVINAVGGTFRFLTGNSPKNAYRIDTPTGTMGVRGTAFDFTVDDETGETSVLLYHGGVRMCGSDGCRILSNFCDIGVTAKRETTSILPHSDGRRMPYVPGFPYLASQRSLKAEFRLEGTRACRQLEAPALSEEKAAQVASVPPSGEPQPPPSGEPPADDDDTPPAAGGHDNNGGGNGGDTADEGDSETGNPGKGNGGGNANGGGNGNGNGKGKANGRTK